MIRKGRFPCLVFLAGYLACSAAWTQDLAAVRARGKLVLLGFPNMENAFLSVNLETGPMVKAGPPENFKGFDVELMKRFATSLGVTLEVRPVGEPSFGALIPELLAGRGDLIAGGFSITQERQELVDFSRPYYEVVPVVITPRKSDLVSLKDLAAKTGAVLAGSANELRLKRLGIPTERIRPVEFGSQGLAMVAEGRVDYWLTEVGAGDTEEAPLEGNSDLKVALRLPEREGVGVAARKNSDLLKEFDRFVEQLEKSGELRRLKTAWLGK